MRNFFATYTPVTIHHSPKFTVIARRPQPTKQSCNNFTYRSTCNKRCIILHVNKNSAVRVEFFFYSFTIHQSPIFITYTTVPLPIIRLNSVCSTVSLAISSLTSISIAARWVTITSSARTFASSRSALISLSIISAVFSL